MTANLGALYRGTRERMTALAATLTDADLDRVVPATPLWRVRDVFAHVTGVAADILDRRVEGAGGDAWTAAQVAARSGMPFASVLDEWARVGVAFEALMDKVGEERFDPRPVADVWAHEQDVRAVFGVAGGWDDGTARWFVGRSPRFAQVAQRHGFVVELTDAPPPLLTPGADGGIPSGRLRVSAPELVRGALGRRSIAQLLAWDWSDVADPEAAARDLLLFGLTEHDLHDAIPTPNGTPA